MAIRLRTNIFFVFVLSLLFSTVMVLAEDDIPAPELLYRDGDSLMLVDGYIGETTVLLSDLAERDTFSWSPDGQYLLAFLQDDERYGYCLNLLEVDSREWLYSEAISCDVKDALFSSDAKMLIFSTINEDDTRASVWRFVLEDESKQELFRATGDNPNNVGISYLNWSPTEKYLSFVSYYWIMGGTLNSLVVMDAETFTYVEVQAPDTYYAFYHPIWSADDEWFLIVLQEEYAYSGTLPATNHEGDVYLVYSQSGEKTRLSYSPSSREINIHWTESGEIAFTEIIEEAHLYTVEEALAIEAVPDDEIVMPEEIDPEAIIWGSRSDIIMSPDPHVAVRIYSDGTEQTGYTQQLLIGNIYAGSDELITITLSDRYEVFGWRPSDYAYPQGE